MRRRIPQTAVGLAAIGLCGCTLVGFGIGKAVDHSGSHGPKSLVQQDLLTLRLGEPLEVQLWDGTKLSGRFRGLHWMSPGDYGPAYESARAGAAPNLPRLGPGAVLVKTSGQSIRGEYRGIGPGFVALGETRGRLSTFDLDLVMTLTDASGGRITGRDLEGLVEERAFRSSPAYPWSKRPATGSSTAARWRASPSPPAAVEGERRRRASSSGRSWMSRWWSRLPLR